MKWYRLYKLMLQSVKGMAGLRPASPRMMPVRAPPRSLNYYVVTKALALHELMERALLGQHFSLPFTRKTSQAWHSSPLTGKVALSWLPFAKVLKTWPCKLLQNIFQAGWTWCLHPEGASPTPAANCLSIWNDQAPAFCESGFLLPRTIALPRVHISLKFDFSFL